MEAVTVIIQNQYSVEVILHAAIVSVNAEMASVSWDKPHSTEAYTAQFLISLFKFIQVPYKIDTTENQECV